MILEFTGGNCHPQINKTSLWVRFNNYYSYCFVTNVIIDDN